MGALGLALGREDVGDRVGASELSQQLKKPSSDGQHLCPGLNMPVAAQRGCSSHAAMDVGLVVGNAVGLVVGDTVGDVLGLTLGALSQHARYPAPPTCGQHVPDMPARTQFGCAPHDA